MSLYTVFKIHHAYHTRINSRTLHNRDINVPICMLLKMFIYSFPGFSVNYDLPQKTEID